MNEKKFMRKMEKVKKQCEQHKKMKELLNSYDEYLPVAKAKKKRKVSNIMLTISVVSIVLYTIANFWLMYSKGYCMDSAVTTAIFSFFGGELLILGGMKTSKIIKGTDDTNSNSESGC